MTKCRWKLMSWQKSMMNLVIAAMAFYAPCLLSQASGKVAGGSSGSGGAADGANTADASGKGGG